MADLIRKPFSFYNPSTGIYTSPRPPVSLPPSPITSIIDFLFRRNLSNSPALIDPENDEIVTFSQLKAKILAFSHALMFNYNIGKNDVVLIVSPNSILFPVAFLAVAGIGAVASTANPLYTVSELSHQIKDANPKLIITVDQLCPKLNGFNLPIVSLSNFADLIAKSPNPKSVQLPSVSQDDVAVILYSSGTTGLSKGVMLTHRSIIATAVLVTSDDELYNEGMSVFLLVVPLFHVMGLVTLTYSQIQRGNTMVVMAKFELEKALASIEKYRVTHFHTAPPVVVALVKHKEAVGRYDMSSLKEIGSGAAPLTKEAMDECSKVLPQAKIMQVI